MDEHPRTYEGRLLPHPDEEVFDQGLGFDLETMISRRRLLVMLGSAGLGGGLLGIAGCGSSSQDSAPNRTASSSAETTTAGGNASSECSAIPEETTGPYPGDGSNGPDVLTQSGVVRSDIRPSFGDYSGRADGIPLTIRIAVRDASNDCRALAGASVYVWHCDRDGAYSLYTVANQNYLRGIQETGSDGIATFESVFPACYAGRWPHIHFEVYPSLQAATGDATKIATSQLALPESACTAVYATSGYEQSVTNLKQVSLRTDNVFGDDGAVHQLGTVAGGVAGGYVVELAVPVSTV